MTIEFTPINLRRTEGKRVFAVVDVTCALPDMTVTVCGIQARRLRNGGTSLHPPTYRDRDGKRRPAILLPLEIVGPLSEAIIAYLVAHGLAAQGDAVVAGIEDDDA